VTRTDNKAHARTVLDQTTYAVLATADTDGTPWATPVWFAHDGLDRLYWLSWPGSRHSQLIEQRADIALTVFDSRTAPNQGAAFYATARARQCPDAQLDAGLEVVNRRLSQQDAGGFTRERVTGESRLRLYVAEITDAWVLDQDAAVDQRAPVPR
jgi:nitroimidazol reductase NimA-like FMN-containing flavoprotein (pyridoxamine 5'-phosphate oxidase superfamily)